MALARCAIAAALAEGTSPEPRIPDIPSARQRRGAFVSLYERGGDLRGCIGHVQGDRSLGEVIRQVAVSAAQHDPRFPPVTHEELAGLRIEISVLSEPVRMPAAEVARLVIGRDGVLVRNGRAQAVLLPQVATEQGFGPEAFLDAVCRKAGLAPGSWREPAGATQVFTFTADVFAESPNL
jgi:AmmeMemoRadiSam system protein A